MNADNRPSVKPDHYAWGVFHQLRAGGKRIHRLRLVVEDVPTATKRAELLEALEAAGHAGRYSDAGIPWANHTLLREDRWPPVLAMAAGEDRAGPLTLTWDRLSTIHADERKLTIPISPSAYAAVQLAAARSGLSMRAYTRRVLEAAAGNGGEHG